MTAHEAEEQSAAKVAPLLVSRADAARTLGIGTTTLDALIASGDLRAVRVRRRVLLHPDDLASFVERARSNSLPADATDGLSDHDDAPNTYKP